MPRKRSFAVNKTPLLLGIYKIMKTDRICRKFATWRGIFEVTDYESDVKDSKRQSFQANSTDFENSVRRIESVTLNFTFFMLGDPPNNRRSSKFRKMTFTKKKNEKKKEKKRATRD